MNRIHVSIALVALMATLFTWTVNRVRDRRIKQAELLRNYTNDFYADTSITQLFLDIDQDRYSFDDTDIGTDRELALIHVLDFLNILGYNWLRRVVRLRDIAPTTLGYAAVRLHANPRVVWYLKRIERLDLQNYLPGNGFGYYRELAAALAAYPGSASNRVSARIHVALNQVRHEFVATARARLRLMLPRGVATTERILIDLSTDVQP